MFLTFPLSIGPLALQLLWTFGTLAVLGALAWLAVRVVTPVIDRRRGQKRMRVVEKLPLEPGRSLYLVEVDGRDALIGVCAGQLTSLPMPQKQPSQATGQGALSDD